MLHILALFALLIGAISIPVLTHRLPPLSDYVNHLARMHVIDAVDSDPYLARFYEIQWQIIPNLVMDAIVPLLARVLSIYHAGQFFLISIFVMILSGTLALNRALSGRWSALPLAATPLLYNNALLVGVLNYLFGIGVALWALAVWIALRERAWYIRLGVATAFVLALFFCHLFAVGVYGIGILAFELQRLWAERARPLAPRLADFCASTLPFLPVIPLLMVSPTMELVSEYSWEPTGKIDGLVFVFDVYNDVVALIIAGIAVLALVWAVRHRIMRFHPLGWLLLAVGGIVYLALPRVLFSTYMADQRLPIGLVFMLVACLDLELRHRIVRQGFAAMLLVLVAARVAEVQLSWNELSRPVESVYGTMPEIERGASVLVAYADPSGGDDVRDFGLVHAACLAMIERSALVTTAFTVSGKQIMHVREEYADHADTEDGSPPTVEQLVLAADKSEGEHYWEFWPKHFDYVYVLFTEPGAENPDPVHLRLVAEGPRFQLYRSAEAATTATATATAGKPQEDHVKPREEDEDDKSED
ncbi:MAG TPA: hypothetical protein VKT73_03385 [Xanthobacteraceae bacterium]|nr:hypothetical protein [Xanthobacteraceae bacterium]